MFFVTKKCLPRRMFLRGTGTAIALPLLDAMVPALTAEQLTAAAPVRRLGFIYYPSIRTGGGPQGKARTTS